MRPVYICMRAFVFYKVRGIGVEWDLIVEQRKEVVRPIEQKSCLNAF